METDKLHTCSFSGHRPEKLEEPEAQIRVRLEKEIRRAVAEGYTGFITGMACGVDIWAGEIAARLKGEFPGIRLTAVVPYTGVELRWSADWQEKFRSLLAKADDTVTLYPFYSHDAFQKRNVWMVDHSSRLIAVFNGKLGGTKDTIDYARSRNVEVDLI